MQIDRVDLGKAPATTDFEKNLDKSFQRLMDQLVQILNKGLIPSDNFSCYIGSITTNGTPGVESSVAHGLKRVPSGYIVLSRNQAGFLYDGSSPWTVSNIYVKANVASLTTKIMIF